MSKGAIEKRYGMSARVQGEPPTQPPPKPSDAACAVPMLAIENAAKRRYERECHGRWLWDEASEGRKRWLREQVRSDLEAALGAEARLSTPGREEAIRALWEAATALWDGEGEALAAELEENSIALPGKTLRGKDLYWIGVALGYISDDEKLLEVERERDSGLPSELPSSQNAKREALERLQYGPDTLTQDGLQIVLAALYPEEE